MKLMKMNAYRCLTLGPVFGLIHCIILAVDCMFFKVLEVLFPRESIHYVEHEWDVHAD